MCRVKTESRKKNMTRKDEPANSQKCLSAYSTNEVNGHEVKLQLDTTFDIALISSKTWRDVARPALILSNVASKDGSGGILNFEGEMKLHVRYGDQRSTETKPDFRKKNVTQNVEPMVSQVTGPMASSKIGGGMKAHRRIPANIFQNEQKEEEEKEAGS
ncbi:hypothetical protein ACTXT7_003224 [Hymenolepis weldensis]